MQRVAEGVWRLDPLEVIHLGAGSHAFLRLRAPTTAKKKARICAHQPEESLQEMLICQGPDAAIDMHEHEAAESCVLISGRMKIEFTDRPTITMRAGDYVRIPAHTKHRPRPLEPCVLLEYTLK